MFKDRDWITLVQHLSEATVQGRVKWELDTEAPMGSDYLQARVGDVEYVLVEGESPARRKLNVWLPSEKRSLALLDESLTGISIEDLYRYAYQSAFQPEQWLSKLLSDLDGPTAQV